MAKIHIVTDSGADIPADLQKQYGIFVVPLSIQFGEQIFLDNVDLSTQEFYQKLQDGSVLPSTCQPSPADFAKLYEEIAAEGDTIISVHLSSKLSGTYQSAVLASSMVSGIKVYAVDSLSASFGIGLTAIRAAQAVQAGKTAEEITAELETFIRELQVFFVVDTLEYLKRNGRIGKAQALVGTLLSIKPVLTLVDGVVTPHEKVRGKAKAMKRVGELAAARKTELGEAMEIAVIHADCVEQAEKLAALLTAETGIDSISISDIGPTIGVHTGPGTLGAFFFPPSR